MGNLIYFLTRKFAPTGLLALCCLITLVMPSPVRAEIRLELGDEQSFQGRKLIDGAIEVNVTYAPYNPQQRPIPTTNLSYQIFYNGVLHLEEKAETWYSGSVSLKDLDNNGSLEVVVETYSGGAHCCTNFTIYTWQNNQFLKTETGLLDAGGGSFEDLDDDRHFEFVTYNNAFLYQFSSYAGSFPPSVIYSFREGELKEVTKEYPDELRSTAGEMYQSFLESQQDDSEVNGILAGYVAQKILMGEYEEGWQFMLAHYDHSSDWGLDIYEGDRVVARHPDFPTALKAFLIEQGYLDQDGKPL